MGFADVRAGTQNRRAARRYRNLVKALPWYTSVREKLTDPQYSGWFLKFKPGGSINGSWHSPPCTTDKSGEKCSGPSRAKSASRSLRRALLISQVKAGSLYRRGERT